MRFLIISIFLLPCILISQELNCKISVNYSSIQSPNREMFNSMRQSIYEFMNNTVWTNDIFTNEERISSQAL